MGGGVHFSSIAFEVIRKNLGLFICFFYEKILSVKKHVVNKNKRTISNKGNNFSRAKKLLGGCESFVLLFGA